MKYNKNYSKQIIKNVNIRLRIEEVQENKYRFISELVFTTCGKKEKDKIEEHEDDVNITCKE